MGCAGTFIKSFNPGTTIVQANYNYVEQATTEVNDNAHCTPSLTTVCPPTQVFCNPVFYIDPHQDNHGGTCSSTAFFSAKQNDESGWQHTSPNPVSSGTRVSATVCTSGTRLIQNFGDIVECTSGTTPPVCNGNGTATTPVNAAWWKAYLSNSADFVSSNDAFFEDNVEYSLTLMLSGTGQTSTLEMPTSAAMITQEAYWNDAVAPFPMYMNYFGCAGFGTSNNVTIDYSLFTQETKTNDKMAIAESCITDAGGVDKESGTDPFVNSASDVLSCCVEKIGVLQQASGSNGKDAVRREFTALIWILDSALRPYGSSKQNWVVSWEDVTGGGVNTNDTDLYPEELIYDDPTTAVVPGVNGGGMRPFVQNNMAAPGSGCPNKGSPTPGFGGMSDALIPGTCGTGTNSAPDGAFAAEFGACWWKGTVNLGYCGTIWNHRTTAITLVAGVNNHICVQGTSWCTYYPYTKEITWTGLQVQYANNGQVGCVDCNATISLPCVVGDSGVTSPTTMPLPFTLAAHDAVQFVQ